MDDYLLFLGTAGDHTVLAQSHSSYGIVFYLEGKLFLADPGPGAFLKAVQYTVNPTEIEALMLTHNHLMHINDANVFIMAMTDGCNEKKGHLFGPKNLFARAPKKHIYLPPFFRNHVKNHHSLKAGDKVRIGTTDIKATPVEHPDGGLGYKITTPYQTISYVGDTSYEQKVIKAHEGCTILILNCKNPINIEEKGQMNITETQRIIEYLHPEVVFLNHLGSALIKTITPIDLARELQKKTGVHVVAAKEGLRTPLSQYIAKHRQKTLEGY